MYSKRRDVLSSNTVIHTGAERVYFVPDGVVTIFSMAFIRILLQNFGAKCQTLCMKGRIARWSDRNWKLHSGILVSLSC